MQVAINITVGILQLVSKFRLVSCKFNIANNANVNFCITSYHVYYIEYYLHCVQLDVYVIPINFTFVFRSLLDFERLS